MKKMEIDTRANQKIVDQKPKTFVSGDKCNLMK